MTKGFNIRVYGIALDEQNRLLVSDEQIKGLRFTKFPGGGLEWGESTIDCLKREFREELNQEIEVMAHFYTTDYFQRSAFNPDDQLLSIYYRVKLIEPISFIVKSKPFDFSDQIGSPQEVHRWIPMADLNPELFKWPVDKLVTEQLRLLHV